MKEKIPYSEFIENVRKGLSPLTGKFVKITLRTNGKNELKTHEGTLISVKKDLFTLRNDYGDGKSSDYRMLDVHYYSAPFEEDPVGTWPLRHRELQ